MSEYLKLENAADYRAAQQPELDALKKDGTYSPWQYMKDLPDVAKAKFNVWRATDSSMLRNQHSPGDVLDAQMDQMRELALRQHANPNQKKQSGTDVDTQNQWDSLKNGSLWMNMPIGK